MQTKKHKHADLERKRSVFFQIGLIVALGSAFAAFEWSSQDVTVPVIMNGDPYIEEIDLPEIIRVEEPKPEPIEKMKLKDIINVVTDDTPVDTDVEVISEPTDETIYEIPEPEPEEVSDEVFIIVERMPEFPGGDKALMQYFANNIKYPAICAELGVQGRVYVSFVIGKDGGVTDIQVLRSPDANLSKEAARVVAQMPEWSPGKQRGKSVRVAYTVPVNFRLQ